MKPFITNKTRETENNNRSADLSSMPNSILNRIFSNLDRPSLDALAQSSDRLAALISPLELLNLPTELLLNICSYLDRSSLGRVAQVSSLFRDLAYAECLWLKPAKQAIATCTDPYLPAREKVRISKNWATRRYEERTLLVQNVRYMPRLQLEEDTLWVSWGNRIWAHERDPEDGTINRLTKRVLTAHRDDVSKFVVKDGLLVSGGSDRSLVAWESGTGRFLFAKRYCHRSEISGVDVVSFSNRQMVITGSTDGSVKFWAAEQDNQGTFPSMVQSTFVDDRIYSLAASPTGDTVIVGSAGLTSGVPSVHAIDMATNETLPLGQDTMKRGAGTLDVVWHGPNTFLSCGHDTRARLWDTRANKCVRVWEEPFDDAIYCMTTDCNMTLLCGMARHGLVRLWDMRQTEPVSFYHTKHAHNWQSSPVYSIAADSCDVYVAMDQCLNLLSFSGDGSGYEDDDNRQNMLSRKGRCC